MTGHVPDELLTSFVHGDVGEQIAIHVAKHVDDCPACATRAAALEPLAAAFAAVDDPVAPDDLADVILARYEEPQRGPAAEVVVGLGMLAAAAALIAGTSEPVVLATDFGVALQALVSGAGSIVHRSATAQLLLSVSALGALLGCILAARVAFVPPTSR